MDLLSFIKPTKLSFLERQTESNGAYTYVFEADSDLAWKAGQHGMLEIKLASGHWTRRMFSLSSAPLEKMVHITAYWRGDEASDFKKTLHKLQPGCKF